MEIMGVVIARAEGMGGRKFEEIIHDTIEEIKSHDRHVISIQFLDNDWLAAAIVYGRKDD